LYIKSSRCQENYSSFLFFGIERAMKGGFGTASKKLSNGLIVGAAVAVNAFGDVVNNENREIIAGARDSEDGHTLINSFEHMKKGITGKEEFFQNTTLGVVATNAVLTKMQAIFLYFLYFL